jgi:transposase-like protein
MTKGEQVRLTAWRWKVLQQAADELNVARVCRHFGISRKSFYKWKRRHPTTAPRGCVTDHGRRTDHRAPHHAT